MATYGQNTTLKVNAAIAVSSSASPSAQVLYTCPANSYAILNGSSTGGGVFFLAGIPVNSGSATTTTIYVGPGQQLTVTGSGGSVLSISGVEFTNTP